MCGNEKAANNFSGDSMKLDHDALVEYYKKKYHGNTRLAEMLVKLIEAQEEYNSGKRKTSPLQLLHDYPDAIKAIAMANVATKCAAESSDVKSYKSLINRACSALDDAIKQNGLPAYLVKYIKALRESTLKLIPSQEDGKVSDDERKAAIALGEKYPDIIEYLIDIYKTLQNFLRKFENVALKNEKTSKRNACWSLAMSIIAIIISAAGIVANMGIQWYFACRAEINDKTGELIEVVKTHYAVTDAQNKHEISRLQEELKKSQNRCDDAQRKLDELSAGSMRAQQRLQREISSLQSEIAALKKKVEALEAALAKKSAQPSVPEAKK